jgi:hypothetical protein
MRQSRVHGLLAKAGGKEIMIYDKPIAVGTGSAFLKRLHDYKFRDS